jgi:hypothetical protein
MMLSYARPIGVSELLLLDVDICVASSGFEKRAPFFFQTYNLSCPEKAKVVFAFNDRQILKDKSNIESFNSLGFRVESAFENRFTEIETVLKSLLHQVRTKEEVNIAVDYSCMTKVWYAGIIKFFSTFHSDQFNKINVFFVYSQSIFEPPIPDNPNYSASLLSGFHYLDSPDKVVACIIGLGYEENRALGLVEYLHVDYKNCYLFKSDKASNLEFYEHVNTSNKDLIDLVPNDHIFDYPLRDLAYTDAILSTLVKYLVKDNNRVVIAPLGPKPFALLSILLATTQTSVNIFRVTQINNESIPNRFADEAKEPLICHAVFEK